MLSFLRTPGYEYFTETSLLCCVSEDDFDRNIFQIHVVKLRVVRTGTLDAISRNNVFLQAAF